MAVLHNYTRKNGCYRSSNKLLQICSQVVSKLCSHCLCPCLLQQFFNKLSTTCNKLDGIIRLAARLFQQGWYEPCITRMLQRSTRTSFVTMLLYHDCIGLVNNLATSLIISTKLLQIVNSLLPYLVHELGTSSANTTLLDGLVGANSATQL